MELDEADEMVRTPSTAIPAFVPNRNPHKPLPSGLPNGNRTPRHASIHQAPIPGPNQIRKGRPDPLQKALKRPSHPAHQIRSYGRRGRSTDRTFLRRRPLRHERQDPVVGGNCVVGGWDEEVAGQSEDCAGDRRTGRGYLVQPQETEGANREHSRYSTLQLDTYDFFSFGGLTTVHAVIHGRCVN